MLAKFLTPAVRAAAPLARTQVRAMTQKVEDVKLKDLPAYAAQSARDPQTRTAIDAAMFNYYKEYVKTGSAAPVFHVIGIMMIAGYSVDYYFHLRHEANYKYH